MADVIVSNSSDEFVVGVPPNNGAFFDGTRYWIFYNESTTLKCMYGTSLSSMSSTNTDGAGNITGLDGDGKSFAVVFGQLGSTWYAWAVVDTEQGAVTGAHIDWFRWELTASGLSSPTNVSSSITDKTGGMFITHDYGSEEVGVLYGGAQKVNTNRAHRKIDADMTSEAGIGGLTFYDALDVGYLETGKFIKLTDGYLSFGFSTDPSGNTYGMEKTTSTLSLSGTFTNITGTGAGSFSDANYAATTSHMGQADDCQLDDGTYYVAYVDDADATNGNYGHIILRKRGNTMASTWSTVSTDVIGSSAEAWHIALSTDGTDIWIFYCKDNSGTRDTAIYYKKYDVSEDTFGTETKLADLQASHTFERMFTQWRAANGEIVVAWSEKNGSNYDLLAASINTAGSTAYTVTASINSILQKQGINANSSVDALLQKSLALTADIDALLQKAGITTTASINALLQKEVSLSASINALLQKEVSTQVSIDAILSSAGIETVSLDALLQKQGVIATATLNALLRKTLLLTGSIDALLRKTISTSAGLDAVLQDPGSGTVLSSLDALLRKTIAVSLSLDAVLQKQGVTTLTSLSALLLKRMTVVASLDAVLYGSANLVVSIDALIKRLGVQVSAVIDAVLTDFVADIFVEIGRSVTIKSSERSVLIQPSNRSVKIVRH